jgi:hypothetical protein
MRVYHDWEFLEDGKTIDQISVGLVAEDGREYYAINRDMPEERVWEHPWLRANVVPFLPQCDGPQVAHGWLDVSHPDVKPLQQIAVEVKDFVLATPDVELWAWYGAFDHVSLAWLYGPMSQLPPGIPMWTNDLRQEVQRLGVAEADLPKQAAGHHNALADARHNRTLGEFLTALETGRA